MLSLYAEQYLFIGLLAVVAILFGIVPLLIAWWIAPKKPSAMKASAYECGIEARSDSWIKFRAQYYIYALLFVVFDIEVMFLFPWALIWKSLGVVAFIEMAIFLAILFVGLIYAWRKGALEWL